MTLKRKSALRQTRMGYTMDKIGIDLMGPFVETENSYTYIVVMQDYFTEWVVAEGLPDKQSEALADVIYKQWITTFG